MRPQEPQDRNLKTPLHTHNPNTLTPAPWHGQPEPGLHDRSVSKMERGCCFVLLFALLAFWASQFCLIFHFVFMSNQIHAMMQVINKHQLFPPIHKSKHGKLEQFADTSLSIISLSLLLSLHACVLFLLQVERDFEREYEKLQK